MPRKAKKQVETFTEEPIEPITESTPEQEVTQLKNDELEDALERIETFKSQLNQSLELNEKLITELKDREKELTLFQEVRVSLEGVIENQQNEITTLKEQIDNLKMEKFQERISGLATKWIKKHGLPESQMSEVTQMLTKFQSEEELQKIENLLGLTTGKEKSSPVPLTQNSNVLVEQFASQGQNDYNRLSPQEKREYLWQQMEQLKKNIPK